MTTIRAEISDIPIDEWYEFKIIVGDVTERLIVIELDPIADMIDDIALEYLTENEMADKIAYIMSLTRPSLCIE